MSAAFQCPPRSITSAAAAPALPVTIKLTPLQRKSSRQTSHPLRPVDKAMAPATRPVLTKKQVAIAAASAKAATDRSTGLSDPPRFTHTRPVAAIVSASAAALKSVRYRG